MLQYCSFTASAKAEARTRRPRPRPRPNITGPNPRDDYRDREHPWAVVSASSDRQCALRAHVGRQVDLHHGHVRRPRSTCITTTYTDPGRPASQLRTPSQVDLHHDHVRRPRSTCITTTYTDPGRPASRPRTPTQVDLHHGHVRRVTRLSR